jgi:hypothetical protein
MGAGQFHGAAVVEDRARVGLIGPGKDLDQRRLAGAVLAEKGMDLAAIERERHVVIGQHRAEALADIAQFPQGGLRHRS